jgi:cysteinyl-tRNA synthetase
MSKSTGNFVTIHELLQTGQFGEQKWPGEVLRLAMLMTHYRQPIDFSASKLKYAFSKLDSWYSSFTEFVTDEAPDRASLPSPSAIATTALADDLNVHGLLVHLDELDGSATRDAALQLYSDLYFIGIDLFRFWHWVQVNIGGAIDEEAVDKLIAARNAARARKDFKKSDEIRAELSAMGVVIKDSKEGTTWEIAR